MAMPFPTSGNNGTFLPQPQQNVWPRGTILDQWGQPLNPTSGKYDDYPVPKVMQFSSLLGSAWRKYWHEKHDVALRHSREDAMAMTQDHSITCLLHERARAVAMKQWHISVPNEKDPHQKTLKDGLTQLVKQTPKLRQMLFYLAKGGAWHGRYGSQLRLTTKEIDLPAAPSKLFTFLNPQFGSTGASPIGQGPTARRQCVVIERSADDPGHVPVNGDKIGHSYHGEPYVLVMGAQDDQLPKGLPREWATIGKAQPLRGWIRERFIIHRWMEGIQDADFWHPMEADQVHGVGIRHFIYFLDYLKREWLSNLTDWVERAGIGVRLWYFNASSSESKERIERAAKDNIHRTNILIPRYTDSKSGTPAEGMEWVDVGGTGAEIVIRLIEYVDGWHERFIIGQSMSGGVGRGSGGSGHGSGMGGSNWADMAADTKNDVIESDAASLAETITSDYLDMLKKYAYPEYREIPAQFEFGAEGVDSDRQIDAAGKAWEMGAGLKEQEVIESAGYTVPQPGDKILRKAEPTSAPGPLGLPGQDRGRGGDPGSGTGRPPGQQPIADQPTEELAVEQYQQDLFDRIERAAQQVNTDATPAQQESGTFRKGHVTVQGLGITIECPRGSTRTGVSRDGTEWSREMKAHYGYAKKTIGADGEHVDVYLGPDPDSELVFVIDQVKPDGALDEHKAMIGFTNAKAARQAYLAHYPAGWTGLGSMQSMTMDQFKDWLAELKEEQTKAKPDPQEYQLAVESFAAHAQEYGISPEMYALDLDQFIDRLRQVNLPEAQQLYQHLLFVLQRFPDLRRDVSLRNLAWMSSHA